MNQYLRIGFVIALIFIPSSAKAGCDTCMQVAAETTKASVETGFQTMNEALKSLKEATEAVADTVDAGTNSVNASISMNNKLITAKLDQSIKAIDAQFKVMQTELGIKNEENIAQLRQLFEELKKGRNLLLKESLYGSRSFPISTSQAGAQSAVLMAAEIKRSELLNEFQTDFLVYLEGAGYTTLLEPDTRKRMLAFIEDNSDLPLSMSQNLISFEQGLNLLKYYKYTIAQQPVEAMPAPTRYKDMEIYLAYKRNILKQYNKFRMLSELVLSKMPLVKYGDWADTTVTPSYGQIPFVEYEGELFTSISSVEHYNTITKATSLAFVDDINLKTPIATQRDLAISSMQQTQLLKKLVEVEESLLLADLLAELK